MYAVKVNLEQIAVYFVKGKRMNKKMSTTVVMTTYNGERFVEEQLQSIIDQSRKPDEIVIMDDGSSDGTVAIVKKLITDSDINCKLYVNKKNIGWRANFINGFHHATGDIVFCTDQDDIWCKDKIEAMANVLENEPQVNVLACNLVPLYEKSASKIADFYVNNYGQRSLVKVSIFDRGLTMLRPGCTLCFRKKLLNLIDLIWEEHLAHDEVIWAIGLVTESLFILNKPLMYFRRHSSNNSPSNEKTIQRRLELAEYGHRKLTNLLQTADVLKINQTILKYLNNQNEFTKERMLAFKKRSVISSLHLFKSYKQHGSIRLWLADLLSIIRG